MASDDELRLGRLAVKHGLVTEQQVIDALQSRSGELGDVLVARGHLGRDRLAKVRDLVRQGQGAAPSRYEATTNAEIAIGGTREILARDQLDDALAAVKKNPAGALRDLRRLAGEFADTESGVRAEVELKALEKRLGGG